MTSSKMKRLALGAALLANVAAAGVAHAQYGANQGYREDPSSALARHVRTLASDPRNTYALIGAGNAALAVGDTQAALAFLGRADEASPRNGQVKAAMGSAFVQTEQPQAALKMFAEAASLGVATPVFAKDRGLAYDMIGDPVQAQADYRLALQRGPDAEVERRLALSRAISGDRAGALAAIDAQLRRHDKAAWRTRAFVLALTGDTAEAMKSAQANMPPARAAELQPFFARLPQLSPADKALAVHFGHFPQDARYAAVQPIQQPVQQAARQPYTGAAATVAGRPDTRQPSLGAQANTRMASVAPRAVAPAAVAAPKARAEQPSVRRPRIDPRDPLAFRMRQIAEREAREAQAAAKARQQAQAAVRPQPLVTQPPVTQPPVTQPATPTIVQQQAPASIVSAPSAVPIASSSIVASSQPISAGIPVSAAAQTPIITSPSVTPLPSAQASTGVAVQQSSFGLSAGPSSDVPIAAAESLPTAALAVPTEVTSTGSASRLQFADVAAAIASLPVNDGASAGSATDQPAEAKPAQPKPAAPKAETKPAPAKTAQAKKPEPTAAKAAPGKKADPAASKQAEGKKGEAAASKQAQAKKAEPAAKEPSRIWIQLAAAQNKAAFPGEFKRFKAKAPKLLANQSAWTAPLGATNRLLIGPFKTAKEAKDLVNELAKVQISSYSWTSEAGQAVTKISAK